MHRRRRLQQSHALQRVGVPRAIRPFLEELGRLAKRQGVAAYAVGGCVRDWLLGIIKTVDLDVVIEGSGIAFARSAGALLGAEVTVHEQFGTATLLLTRPARSSRRMRPTTPLRLDVASCRKETYAAIAAYPKVMAGALRDDLFRRDFTINAMAMAIMPDQFGKLIDPFGGLRDLRARKLRILHAKSFLDDPSRILRGARFAQRFGLTLDAKTATQLRQALAAGVLARLNRGRVRKELERIVEEPNPVACLAQLGRWLRA